MYRVAPSRAVRVTEAGQLRLNHYEYVRETVSLTMTSFQDLSMGIWVIALQEPYSISFRILVSPSLIFSARDRL